MNKACIVVGGTYTASVTGNRTRVRIDKENPQGGWDATNLATNRPVRIKTAGRLSPDSNASPAPEKEPAKHASPAAACERAKKDPSAGKKPKAPTAAT